MSAELIYPAGWSVHPLGDVVTTIKGKKPKDSGTQTKKRNVPYINIKGFESGIAQQYAAPGNYPECDTTDVLMVWDGARSGLVGRGVSGYIGSTLAKLEADGVNNAYLYYFLRGQYGYLNTNTKGVGIPHIDPVVLKSIPFPVAPPDQQDRIVAEIEKQFSRLDEAVASLKRVKANLKRYKAAVLKAAVEGKLTEEWRKQNPDVEPASKLLERILAERRTRWEEAELAKMKAKGKEPKDDKWKSRYKVQELPEDTLSKCEIQSWVIASAAQISEHIVDGTHHTPTYIDQGVDFISAKDVKGWAIDFTQCRNIPQEEHSELINRCHPKSGHVLVTKSGTIGRVAVVKTERPFSLFESVALIPCLDGMDPNYLAYVVHSEVMGEFGRKSQKGVAVRHLHLEDLRLLPIPIPPEEEQTEIVSIVSQKFSLIEAMESAADVAMKRAQRLRQSALADAFVGGVSAAKGNDAGVVN